QRDGWGHGMAHFVALITLRGPVPAGFASLPAPDPVDLGFPADDDGSRDDPMLGSFISVASYVPDVVRLRSAATRIVIAVGEGSAGEIAHRGGVAVAERLGVSAVTFPGDHSGFLGGEYG